MGGGRGRGGGGIGGLEGSGCARGGGVMEGQAPAAMGPSHSRWQYTERKSRVSASCQDPPSPWMRCNRGRRSDPGTEAPPTPVSQTEHFPHTAAARENVEKGDGGGGWRGGDQRR